VNGAPLTQVSEAPAAAIFDIGFGTARCPEAKVKHERADGPGPICVVDDDDWVCDSLSAMLEAYGFAVRAYSSGAEFLADDRRAKAKCLIIDQHMPALEGLSVVAELRRQDIEVPTILITGRFDAAIVRRAEELGVTATLEKPFPAAQLIELVQQACDPRQ
jgi:FixJ family two-component response regulator